MDIFPHSSSIIVIGNTCDLHIVWNSSIVLSLVYHMHQDCPFCFYVCPSFSPLMQPESMLQQLKTGLKNYKKKTGVCLERQDFMKSLRWEHDVLKFLRYKSGPVSVKKPFLTIFSHACTWDIRRKQSSYKLSFHFIKS